MTGVEMILEGLEEELEKITDKLLIKSAVFMTAGAKRAAPKETKTMASAITFERAGPNEVDVISPISYSGHVEYGTSRIVVGTPEHPRYEWEALRRRRRRGQLGLGQSMPFMRPQIYALEAHLSGMSPGEWEEFLR